MVTVSRSTTGSYSDASHPRFTAQLPWDHQPGVWIISLLSLAYSFLVLGIRQVVRRRTVALHDALLVIAHVLASGSWVAILLALHYGAGKAEDRFEDGAYQTASRLVFGGVFMALAAIGFATSSELSHLRDLIPMKTEKAVCSTLMAACACATLITCLVVSAGCPSSHALDGSDGSVCKGAKARWTVAVVFLIINACITSLLPFYLFRSLQMAWKRKVWIFGAFAMPLLNVVIAATMLNEYLRFITAGKSSIGLVNFLIGLECLLCWSLVCPTMPVVRPMALRFTTHSTILLGGESRKSSVRNRSVPSAVTNPGRVISSKSGRDDASDEIELAPHTGSNIAFAEHSPAPSENETYGRTYDAENGAIQKTTTVEVKSETLLSGAQA